MKRKLLALLLTVAIVYCFSGCFVQELYENYKTESVTMIVTEETIAELEDFPNLLTADLSGSTCYDAMEAYKTAHPEVEVTYTIKVLNDFYPMDTAALDLSAMTAADLPQILDALPRLPKVTEVNLMKPDGTAADNDIAACRKSRRNTAGRAVTCFVVIAGADHGNSRIFTRVKAFSFAVEHHGRSVHALKKHAINRIFGCHDPCAVTVDCAVIHSDGRLKVFIRKPTTPSRGDSRSIPRR